MKKSEEIYDLFLDYKLLIENIEKKVKEYVDNFKEGKDNIFTPDYKEIDKIYFVDTLPFDDNDPPMYKIHFKNDGGYMFVTSMELASMISQTWYDNYLDKVGIC